MLAKGHKDEYIPEKFPRYGKMEQKAFDIPLEERLVFTRERERKKGRGMMMLIIHFR